MNLIELSGNFCNNYLFCLKKASQDLNITLSQSLCLITIPFNGISQTNLASKLNLDLSTLSRNLNRMIKMGLIKKKNSYYDKRSFTISLTSKGSIAYNELIQLIENDLNEVFNKFDIDEKDQMIEFLNKANWQFELNQKTLQPILYVYLDLSVAIYFF